MKFLRQSQYDSHQSPLLLFCTAGAHHVEVLMEQLLALGLRVEHEENYHGLKAKGKLCSKMFYYCKNIYIQKS